ncbi:MAG: ArsR/SmtB family transcription factor [Caulobacteraceae bacterium]
MRSSYVRLESSGRGSRLDATLAALADPRRRAVVEILRAGPRPAGAIAREAGLGLPAASRSLKELRLAGLVETESPHYDARVRIYSLRTGPMAELKRWLEETETLWAKQLASLKAHLERPGAGPETPEGERS